MMLKCDRCGNVCMQGAFAQPNTPCQDPQCGGTLQVAQSLVKCDRCGNAYGSPPYNAGDLCRGPRGGSSMRVGALECGGTLMPFYGSVRLLMPRR